MRVMYTLVGTVFGNRVKAPTYWALVVRVSTKVLSKASGMIPQEVPKVPKGMIPHFRGATLRRGSNAVNQT